jgi:hypothetical protein
MVTPNHTHHHELQIDQDNVLALDNVEIMRQAQLDEINRAEMARLRNPEAAGANLDALTGQFVENQLGIAVDNPRRLEIQAIYRAHSIDRIPTDHWTAGPYTVTPGATPDAEGIVTLDEEQSGRERFTQAVAEYNEHAPTVPNLVSFELSDEELSEFTQAFEQLEVLRSDLAVLAARKSGKAYNIFKGKYDKALKDYNEQLVTVGRLRESQLQVENPDRDDSQRNIQTLEYLMDEQHALREQTVEQFRNTKTNKFIEWFNRGGRARRMIKGIVIGAPVGVLAAFAAPVGAAAALAGSGVIATRFTRSYARKDKHRGTTIAEDVNESAAEAAISSASPDTRVEDLVQHFSDEFEANKAREQSARRKALRWGLGGIAAGASIGWAAGKLSEVSSRDISEKAKSIIGRGNQDTINTPSPTPAPTDVPSVTSNPPESIPSAPQEVPTTQPTAPAAPETNWSDKALTVEKGEGWRRTFMDMNIPIKEWPDLLHEAGPQLEKEGWAYRMPNGEWGISQPGELPPTMLQLIQDSRR